MELMLVMFGRIISFDISRPLTFPHRASFIDQIYSDSLIVFVDGAEGGKYP